LIYTPQDAKASSFPISLDPDNGPLPSQFAFATHPLIFDKPIFRLLVLRQSASEVLLPSPTLMLLAKFGADFLIARHDWQSSIVR